MLEMSSRHVSCFSGFDVSSHFVCASAENNVIAIHGTLMQKTWTSQVVQNANSAKQRTP